MSVLCSKIVQLPQSLWKFGGINYTGSLSKLSKLHHIPLDENDQLAS